MSLTTASPGRMNHVTVDELVEKFPSSTSLASGVSRGSADSTSTMSSAGLPEELPKQIDDEAVKIASSGGEEADEDPLVKYAVGLRDYTKTLYTEARKKHERMEQDRARGGWAGKSGIERLGNKHQTRT